MIITQRECLDIIVRRVPAFGERWHVYLAGREGEPRGLCLDISAFSDFVADLIGAGQTEDLPAIFDLIEELMVGGDEPVRTATATCFLENLLNVTPSKLPAQHYIPLLSSASRAYCQAWDRFTGVTTEGLEPAQL